VEKIAPYLLNFWHWLLEIRNWGSLEGWVARVAVWLLLSYIGLLLLKHMLELILAIKSAGAGLGIPFSFSPEKRAEIRRRQQFCNALLSDLGVLTKAENWNDQFFTDLEAQIEAEGRFFASRVDRLMHRESKGLRRVRSLIGAIESSAEQFLLLVGDPGSGKSVALRHLAHQLARRSAQSREGNLKIPLYINLKELPQAPAEGPTAEFIRNFVLDNVRRGDSDTAAYVKEHWDKYREEGIWFFLFDSFDEIPAVLHAPSGSSVIETHANAIRQFLAGMSGCRGIIASREFKGPNTLPWQKLRILPLSPSRRSELVDNYFLPTHLRAIVFQHLAVNEAALYNNPLFLTLLCRYVKDEGNPPPNDLDLLNKHLDRLARRDSDFLKRRYALDSSQLMAGAMVLARAFAENQSLSLAPTQDEILNALKGYRLLGVDLESLLSALVYVKIGRSDVEARAGDRRFTFAHRRYQEALFVRFMAENPGYIDNRELLTNLHWREYAVTLIQTQSNKIIEGILADATRLLREYGENKRSTIVTKEFGGALAYFDWQSDPALHLLNLLQEGLARRLNDVPMHLREAVDLLLMPRWRSGDFYDRHMVLSVSGLMSGQSLSQILEEAVRFGSEDMLRTAFKQCAFLTEMRPQLIRWLRRRFSDEVIAVGGGGGLAKVEAFGARLPLIIGADYIWKRSYMVRRISLWEMRARGFQLRLAGRAHLVMALYWWGCMRVGFALVCELDKIDRGVQLLVEAFLFFPWLVVIYLLHLLRDVGLPLGEALRVKASDFWNKGDRSDGGNSSLDLVVVAFVFLACANFLSLSRNALIFLNPVGFVGISFGWLLLSAAGRKLSKRKALRRFYSLLEKEECRAQIAAHAKNTFELAEWYKHDPQVLFNSLAYVRSFGRAILASCKPSLKCDHSTYLFEISNSKEAESFRSLSMTLKKATEEFILLDNNERSDLDSSLR
jgi:hypothetical protein